MTKKTLMTILMVLIILWIMGGIVLKSKLRREGKGEMVLSGKQEMVYYYGETCPHCKETEEWMKENRVEEELSIIKKEVYNNQNNFRELQEIAKKCDLSGATGVPFLYAEGKCFIGSKEIEDFLAGKVGLK